MKIHMISNRTQSEDEGRELYRKLSAVSSKFYRWRWNTLEAFHMISNCKMP